MIMRPRYSYMTYSGCRLQTEHLRWRHESATVAPILGEEQLEAGVHELGCRLVDHPIGVLLGPGMPESVHRLDRDYAGMLFEP